MDRIINQTHSKEAFLYALSRMLERGSYYGLRTLLILYMISDSFKMSKADAYSIYGWFAFSIMFSQILGAIFGDLIIGNKKAIIIGGIIQAIGAFTLCIPSITGLYFGIGLVGLGTGFYSPNLISQFGKLYLDKTKLLDSGFSILYLAVNIGAFFGVLIIGYIGEQFNWSFGFGLAGILFILSLIFPLITKKQERINKNYKNFNISHKIIIISLVIIFVGIFWSFYEISSIGITELQWEIKKFSNLSILKNSNSLKTIIIIPISLAAIIFWLYFYYSQIIKLIVGFILGAISFGMLYIIPEAPIENQLILLILSLIILGVAEIHISPIIHSTLTKYINPKYLAIAISLSVLPSRLPYFLFTIFDDEIYNDSIFTLKLSFIAMSFVCIGLILLIILLRKTNFILTMNNNKK